MIDEKKGVYCRYCNKYYRVFSDDDEILSEGCRFDLPFFSSDRIVNCNSYSTL